MWHYLISKDLFLSRFTPEDETLGTGKWVVTFPLGDPDDLWERLVKAACAGDLDATKRSSARLDEIAGHHIACVYCRTSDAAYVGRTLEALRGLGVSGPLRYKSDQATRDGRDAYLWESEQIEAAPEAADRPGV